MFWVIREINAREKYSMSAFENELDLANHTVYADDIDELKEQVAGYEWREPREDETEDDSTVVLIGEPMSQG